MVDGDTGGNEHPYRLQMAVLADRGEGPAPQRLALPTSVPLSSVMVSTSMKPSDPGAKEG